MNKKFLFAAVALVALASCSTDEFIGENTNSPDSPNSGAIVFGLGVNGATRADMYGSAAAEMLGNNFYVTGTKGTEAETSPSPTLVFDNYLVHYEANTAGTKESNTANWEYVGVTPGTAPTENYDKLSSLNSQTIKYWDYSADQYDFLAFSTGSFKAKKDKTNPAADEIGVTTMKYGTDLASPGVAYTFYIPAAAAIQQAYITDITPVVKTNYGKEVTLRFKNLGSKVRMALYETVPGYSVKDVKFYSSTSTPIDSETAGYVEPTEQATLISADAEGFPTKGSISVYFPRVGSDNSSKADYNKAAATVSATTSSSSKTQTYGALTDNYTGKDPSGYETNGKYLGRSLPQATFAGSDAADYYQTVFPVSSSSAITLRVDYTLVSIDGSGEEINIYGAKAVVPATYTAWLPNYAYTYIFKISDNTNGWTTSTGATDANQGLYPITFDAVVAEATDATGKQATITTVATHSITTYQQGHDPKAQDEYSKSQKAGADQTNVKDLYVQVMNNSGATPTLVTDLNGTNKSLLFAVTTTGTTISEATVMDALQNRTNSYGDASPVGRNGITLTTNANISNTETSIVNGVDDQPITKIAGTAIAAGQVAKIDIDKLAAGTYAYVYATTVPSAEEKIYQVVSISGSTEDEKNTDAQNYYEVTLTGSETPIASTASEADRKAKAGKVYFVKNVDATGAFVSYTFKQTKVGADVTGLVEATIGANKASSYTAGNFYFDVYNQNNGAYAVKVIKVVE